MSHGVPFLTIHVTEEHAGWTFSQFLRRHLGVSRALLRRLRLYGDVRADGVSVRMIDPVQPGQKVELFLESGDHSFVAEDMPLDIVFEDEHLLVLNKSPGILVHPTGYEQTGTLANGIVHYLEQKGEPALAGPVTRLDRNTSGLVLFAKHPHAHYRFSQDMNAGRLDRVYTAVVSGWIEADAGLIDAPIRRVAEFASQREVGEGGQTARTAYNVLARHGSPEKGQAATVVRATLETGRTHQIRVHLAHMGHPILGDPLYGTETPQHIGRQALHATTLGIVHPLERTEIQFTIPLPPDMEKLIASFSAAEDE